MAKKDARQPATKAGAKAAPKKSAASRKTATKAAPKAVPPARKAPRKKAAPAAKPVAKKPVAKKAAPKKAAARATPKKLAAAKAAKKPAIAKKPAAKPVAKAAKAPAPRKVAPKKPAPPKAAAKKPAAPKRLVKKIIEKPAAPKRPVKKTVEKPVPKKAMAAKAPRKPPIKAAPPVQPEAKPAEETVVEGVEVTTDKAGLMTSGIYGGVVVCESPGRLPKRSPYSQRERERLHKQLMQERERVTESLARLEQAGIAAGSYSDEHKVPGYSNDPTEFASDYQAADTSLGLRALEETRRQQVEEAMTRMRDGLYGVCVACGSKIGYQRLMAKPFAVLCISCMENYEKRRPR